MIIPLLLLGGSVLLVVFLLGYYSREDETARLQKENRQLRNLLDKACSLDELSAQTYSKIVCELVAIYTQAQRDAQGKK